MSSRILKTLRRPRCFPSNGLVIQRLWGDNRAQRVKAISTKPIAHQDLRANATNREENAAHHVPFPNNYTNPVHVCSEDSVYRTRVSSPIPPIRRPDPVIWGNHTGVLNLDQLQLYERKGFLQVEQLLDDTEIASLNADLHRLLSSPDLFSDPRCVVELSSQEVRSIFEVHKVSPVLSVLLSTSKMAGIARQILGSDVYIHQSRINFKPAFEGKGFYWHSDFETWHAEDGMPVPRALSFSVSLTANSYANGPLMIIPGSHKTFVSCVGATPDNHHLQSLREQEIGVADKQSLTMLASQGGGVDVLTGTAGSVVLFDSNCMHGSSDNITPSGRCNLFLVFNSTENTLKEPYYARTRRPEYIAARDFTPV